MPDSRTRAQARKDLRDYDNPKSGRNPNFNNLKYLQSLEFKYEMKEKELRAWANSIKYERVRI